MTVAAPPRSPTRLLAADRRPGGWDPVGVVRVDAGGRGAVAVRVGPAAVARAEPGPAGALRLDARAHGSELQLEVRGPAATPPEAAAAALGALAGWVGVHDEPGALGPLLAPHPRLRDAARRIGPVRLGALPTVGEALGRAVLAQLVQADEARRSMRELTARAGTPTGDGLWSWPEARQVGRTPAWVMRRCGVSLRAARALHAGAVENPRLESARRDLAGLDRRLRALPGVGVWTTAKARAALGDPDAVPVGDWNLPAVVCTALTSEDRGRAGWTDAHLLELLAPFAGQRGRVITLVKHAIARGLLPRHRRRAPRAPRSGHRYW